MISFALCDDNKKERALIHELLDEYLSLHSDISSEIEEFPSAVELNQSIEDGKIPDIILLDICMPAMNGVTLARKIRGKNLPVKIIFLTTSRDYAVEAFSLEASHYIVKPFSKSDFASALDRAIESFRMLPKKISITGGAGVTSFVEIGDIIYIESQGYKHYVHTKNGTLTENKRTLTQFLELFEELSPGQFIIPYRGYIINLNEIRTITSKFIEMQNGDHILIKAGDFAKIKNIYFNYSFEWGEV